MKSFVLCSVFLLGIVSSSFASVVYETGEPQDKTFNGSNINYAISAESFSLAQNTLITGVNFWSVELPTAYNSIYYGFYNNASEKPNAGRSGG